MINNRLGPVRTDDARLHREVRLIGFGVVDVVGFVGRRVLLRLRRNGRSHPVFVGDAEPTALAVEALHLVVFREIGVSRIFQRAAEDADEAFMHHPVMGGVRKILPVDETVGKQCDRC